MSTDPALQVSKHSFGGLIQPGGLWIGAHYSKTERRWCLNLLPCLTLYWVRPGGFLPVRKVFKKT